MKEKQTNQQKKPTTLSTSRFLFWKIMLFCASQYQPWRHSLWKGAFITAEVSCFGQPQTCCQAVMGLSTGVCPQAWYLGAWPLLEAGTVFPSLRMPCLFGRDLHNIFSAAAGLGGTALSVFPNQLFLGQRRKTWFLWGSAPA